MAWRNWKQQLEDDRPPGPSPWPFIVRVAIALGVLAAGLSVTSPHTIAPELDLAAVLTLGRQHGMAVGAEVAEATVSPA